MSHFYSKIQGNRGAATRCGTKDSGVTGCVASWDGAIRSELWYDPDEDVNKYSVIMIPWRGAGITRILKTGVVGKVETDDGF